jgi:NADH:ubiquinone oxidoreductase subunit E
LLDGLRSRYEDDTAIMVEEVECIAACDRAPAIQINYEYYGPVDTTAAVDIIEQYRRGELRARTISGSSRGEK